MSRSTSRSVRHSRLRACQLLHLLRLKPLREAASFPWKQPSRLFVLLQIYGGVTDLDGCSSPRAARYSRGGEFWKVISSQICECSRLQDLRWLSILKPLRRSGSHSASATMKSTPVSAISFDEHLCGREEEAMSISVVLSRTPSRAYVFRRRWKGRFQQSRRQSRTAG